MSQPHALAWGLSQARWRSQPCAVRTVSVLLARASFAPCVSWRTPSASCAPVAPLMDCHGCKPVNFPQPPECSASAANCAPASPKCATLVRPGPPRRSTLFPFWSQSFSQPSTVTPAGVGRYTLRLCPPTVHRWRCVAFGREQPMASLASQQANSTTPAGSDIPAPGSAATVTPTWRSGLLRTTRTARARAPRVSARSSMRNCATPSQ